MNYHTRTLIDYFMSRYLKAAAENKLIEFDAWCRENPTESGLQLVRECQEQDPKFDVSQVDNLEFQNSLINEIAALIPESHRQLFLGQVRPN